MPTAASEPEWMGAMNQYFKTHARAAALIFAMACGAATPAIAVDMVTIKVGYGGGGTYDLAARLVGRHLGRFLPDTPDVIVQNVPGGGSLKLAQLLLGAEATDGSVVAAIGPGVTLAAKLDPDNVQFDPLALPWLASLAAVESFCAVSKSTGISSLEDFTQKEFHLGASGKSSTTYLFAALARNALGARFDVVTGFDGVPDIELAMERGEIAGHCVLSYNDLVKGNLHGKVNVIARFGRADVREYQSVPRIPEQVQDPVKRQAAELVESLRDYDFPFVLPAGASEETIETYRMAFDAMVADPEFIAEAQKLDDFAFHPTSGVDLERILRERLSADPAIFEAARQLVQ